MNNNVCGKQLGVGTHEVEKYAVGVCRQNFRKGRNTKLVKEMLQHKIEDAEYVEKCARKDFVRCPVESQKSTGKRMTPPPHCGKLK